MSNGYDGEAHPTTILGVCLAIIAIVIAVLMFTVPMYSLWAKGMRGKADLREAEWNKQILVEEARAKKDSAKLYADAEVERAKGVAESNKIIADGLKNNEEYLKYLYINTLKDLDTELIYVPINGLLPVLEATRLQ